MTQMTRYDPTQVEAKWQKYWLEQGSFAAEEGSDKPKYYILDMFPYPSGAGLHVGHVVGYTATDILARYKRAKGFNVLHPMAWDSFGLPAEQYAIRTGTHPAITTQKNIETYRRQLQALGFSYDWEREFATSDPKYYKWTQWIFTKLVEKGLAYEAEMEVNWCPAMGTVLANEEVENGLSVEGGHPVERRPLRQWILKITAYADRLLADLEALDWPEGIKSLQRHWIGRSEGAQLSFEIEGSEKQIEVFTTRHDTIFGTSYLVLAPEHSLVQEIVTDKQRAEVEAYGKRASGMSDVDRMEHAKEKTGVFTGAYAINPATQQRIPIWIADYVLIGYGTGGVMGVPAHCDRDFDFAKKFGLAIPPVMIPEPEEMREAVAASEAYWMGAGTCVNCSNGDLILDGLSVEAAKDAVAYWLEKQGIGKRTVTYRLRDWLFSRQRYWGEPVPVLHFEDGTKRALELDELPLLPPDVQDYKPSSDGQSPLAKVPEWVEITDPKTGRPAKRETNTMPQWAGSCWYYLRFCDPWNEKEFCSLEEQTQWMPVDTYVGGAEHATLHLLYARFWHKVLHDLNLVTTSEPFSHLFNQGLVVHRSFKRPGGAYVSPETAVQAGDVWVHAETGEKLESHVEKMSKSKLNVVNPDAIVAEAGADSLRMYEMFMGPLDKEKHWNSDAVQGCWRFLNRFYEMATSDKLCEEEDEAALKLGHRLVHDVAKDIEALHFNTAIAKMMSFINAFTKLERYPRSVVAMATQALAPFAPHMAEELWELLGHPPSVMQAPWPKVDQSYLVEDQVTYIVQVNGKLRGRFDLPKDQDEETIVGLAKGDERISNHLEGTIRKVIFVPNRLLNFVVSP